jgi:hypothetical protein
MMRAGVSMSDYEIRHEGWAALTERLGVAGAIRFLAQYDPGHGDYTSERRELLAGVDLESALHEIRTGATD